MSPGRSDTRKPCSEEMRSQNTRPAPAWQGNSPVKSRGAPRVTALIRDEPDNQPSPKQLDRAKTESSVKRGGPLRSRDRQSCSHRQGYIFSSTTFTPLASSV